SIRYLYGGDGDVSDDFPGIHCNERKRQRARPPQGVHDVLFGTGGVRRLSEGGTRQCEYFRFVGRSFRTDLHHASRVMRTSVETTVRSESKSSGMTNSNSWR